ncbi:hypothetical protein LSTR_LSTR001255 [Laodelphax striatellus]|uniref:Cleavage and polyadenylation specificity factor subunit 2 n=1 Tax=Laodelphax striatellus TaxID=195883 RepID=A0A482XBL5_LAOST|nr:hypothetical protein LSTR_LSTR001255 [Laodelphax striatellus]
MPRASVLSCVKSIKERKWSVEKGKAQWRRNRGVESDDDSHCFVWWHHWFQRWKDARFDGTTECLAPGTERESRHDMEEFEMFTLDDVDAAFDKIVQLKYNQSVPMKGKGFGLTIVPLPAGHMIGGTVWKIMKIGEEDIIYAVDFNHKKERHLNGCELEFQRPSLLITDASNATYQQARRRTRDEKLMTNILQTLRNNGNVLVAVDTAGRVLELAHMLDQLWRNKESGLLAYSLALLNNVSYNVVEFAKSQIEWMSDKLMRSFEGARNNPFQFKHLQLCHSMAELNKVPSPKAIVSMLQVVLASTPDMECGFSRELFLQWSSQENNSIIITSRTSPGTLARDLIDLGTNRMIQLQVKRRVRLEGAELLEYHRKEKEAKDRKPDKKGLLDVYISSDSEDDLEILSITKGKHDLMVKHEFNKQQTSFFKNNKKHYPIFPFFEAKTKFDEYGEIIKPEDYKLADVNPEGEDNKENFEVKEEDLTIDMTEVPTKCVSFTKTVQVSCSVQFIDFEGRSDGESMMKILSQLKPRRLVLVRGTPDNTSTMAEQIQQWNDIRVFTPGKGDVVDATTESHIYQVRLTDALISSLEFQKGKNSELAWLDAQIAVRSKGIDAQPTPMETDQENENTTEEEIYTLEPLPVHMIKGHQPSFINELKLSDFKQVLTKNNISSEFMGGVLWCCSGKVAVRRHEAGRETLEVCLSEDYYRVRDLLYEQYAIV